MVHRHRPPVAPTWKILVNRQRHLEETFLLEPSMRLVSMNGNRYWIRFGNVVRHCYVNRVGPVHVDHLFVRNRIRFGYWNRDGHWSIHWHVNRPIERYWYWSIDVHDLLHVDRIRFWHGNSYWHGNRTIHRNWNRSIDRYRHRHVLRHGNCDWNRMRHWLRHRDWNRVRHWLRHRDWKRLRLRNRLRHRYWNCGCWNKEEVSVRSVAWRFLATSRDPAPFLDFVYTRVDIRTQRCLYIRWFVRELRQELRTRCVNALTN